MAVRHGPKGAIPTSRGWINPQTGELLKSQRFTQEQLDEYNGVQMLVEPAPVVEPEPEPEMELIDDFTPVFNEQPAIKSKKTKKKPSNLFS
jgi:hypothetical protein